MYRDVKVTWMTASGWGTCSARDTSRNLDTLMVESANQKTHLHGTSRKTSDWKLPKFCEEETDFLGMRGDHLSVPRRGKGTYSVEMWRNDYSFVVSREDNFCDSGKERQLTTGLLAAVLVPNATCLGTTSGQSRGRHTWCSRCPVNVPNILLFQRSHFFLIKTTFDNVLVSVLGQWWRITSSYLMSCCVCSIYFTTYYTDYMWSRGKWRRGMARGTRHVKKIGWEKVNSPGPPGGISSEKKTTLQSEQ